MSREEGEILSWTAETGDWWREQTCRIFCCFLVPPLPSLMEFIQFLHKVDKCLLSINKCPRLLPLSFSPPQLGMTSALCATVFLTLELPLLLHGGFGQLRVPPDKHRVDSFFFSPDRVELPWEGVTHTVARAIPPRSCHFLHRYSSQAVGGASTVTKHDPSPVSHPSSLPVWFNGAMTWLTKALS